MHADLKLCAQECLAAAEADTMNFPDIVGRLMDAGFESYAIDFRRASAIYYLPSGESVELATHASDARIADSLDVGALRAAVREAQTLAPTYSYEGFCQKAKAAGCAGYVVSFTGQRVVYLGRTGKTYVELFPQPE